VTGTSLPTATTVILPTVTPTPLPTVTATFTPQATASFTPQATATATAEPIVTVAPPVGLALTCVDTPPVIDGVFNLGTEWTGNPLYQFGPDNNPAQLVQVYFTRDAGRLYMAFLINDDTTNATDSLRVYFDTTNNGGDPDTADRFFQFTREGIQSVWAGVGSNSDNQEWNSNYTSSNWQAAIGETGQNQWVVELQIDANAEMAALGNPFGLMNQVLYTNALATWPEGAVSNLADSWETIGNVLCQ
jgi:hypothetical protein